MSRIRNVIPDPGSEFFHSGSWNQGQKDSGSRIRIRLKEINYLSPKKLFLSSRIYDPGCSYWIPDPDLDFWPIPDPGVIKTPDPGSATLILTVVSNSMTCQSASFSQCCGSESGIRCLFDPWIRDPIKVFSRSRIPNPYFWELISEN